MKVLHAIILLLALCNAFAFVVNRSNFNRLSASNVRGADTGTLSMAISFVQNDMRAYAMKLHTKDQAREGEQKAQKPVSKWSPEPINYLQFLVDSRLVYQTMEDICNSTPGLEKFQNTGLERTAALDQDIAWMSEKFSVDVPAASPLGQGYADVLREVVGRSLPGFVCHYYNHYFAHTAGGLMIGRKISEALLEGATLEFYKWAGDVKEMGMAVIRDIDALADTWSDAQKQECLEETGNTFRYGGALLSHLSGKPVH
uniref:Heme oxygenase n=2 Tax=Heterosigma akashiwo TaxID=2829 RepID=A0A6V1QVP2_HETAK|mmetsp:Transcript_24395/g.41955  ORF Transcript_24395/g.41955 Transcript_24395/m.41955 type:complete len:257 (-) Transcript_24395:208-978(-)